MLLKWVDLTKVQVALNDLLENVPSLEVTVPVSKLGPVGQFIGDLVVPLSIENILFPRPTGVMDVLGAAPNSNKLLFNYMLSPDSTLCVSAALLSSRVTQTLNLFMGLGKEPIFNVTIGMAEYLSCNKEFEQEWKLGKVTLKLKFDFEEHSINLCASILHGLIFPHELCFRLQKIIWTLPGISFCPVIDLETPLNHDTFELSCITIGVVDECSRLETFKECEETNGCGWCSARRACMSTSKPATYCDSCPSWSYDPLDPTGAKTNTTTDINPFLTSLERDQAESIEVRFCGDWEKYANPKQGGTIGKLRWMELMKHWIRREGHLEEIFAKLDKNGDQRITYNEYCNTASMVASRVSTRLGGVKDDGDGEGVPGGVEAGLFFGTLFAVLILVAMILFAIGLFLLRRRQKLAIRAQFQTNFAKTTPMETIQTSPRSIEIEDGLNGVETATVPPAVPPKTGALPVSPRSAPTIPPKTPAPEVTPKKLLAVSSRAGPLSPKSLPAVPPMTGAAPSASARAPPAVPPKTGAPPVSPRAPPAVPPKTGAPPVSPRAPPAVPPKTGAPPVSPRAPPAVPPKVGPASPRASPSAASSTAGTSPVSPRAAPPAVPPRAGGAPAVSPRTTPSAVTPKASAPPIPPKPSNRS
ncbi:Ras association (RalGDS/AF-6) and pleckstriny domains 1 [Balamuthia mandrillaris]